MLYELQPLQEHSDKKILIKSSLFGDYQTANVAVAYHAAVVLQQMGANAVEEKAAVRGIENVSVNTHFRGRWDVLSRHPLIIADVAHNQEGLRVVFKQLTELAAQEQKRIIIIYGCLVTKPLSLLLPFFPSDATYYFTQANTKLALGAKVLQRKAMAYGLNGVVYPFVDKAIECAMAAKDAILFITGSFYVVGEAINYLEKRNEFGKETKT